MRRIVIVTFATVGSDTRYRDYSNKLHQLKTFVESTNVEFKAFGPNDVAKSKHNKYSNNFFNLRKGAGYWHWKPVVLLESIDLYPDALILYVDVDVDIVKIDKTYLIQKSKFAALHAFETLDLIQDWTSKECLEEMDPQGIYRLAKIFVASVILLNPDFKHSHTFLLKWMKSMDNRKSLLDPVSFLGKKHRHDQSIFSLLAAKEIGTVKDLGPGFWGHGINMPNFGIEKIWIGTSLDKFGLKSQKISYRSTSLQFLSNLRCSLDILRYKYKGKSG